MYCLTSMKRTDIAARNQGTVESILFALPTSLALFTYARNGHPQHGYEICKGQGISYLAISIAPADQGLVNKSDGFGIAGLPGWREDIVEFFAGRSSDGESLGLEKERR